MSKPKRPDTPLQRLSDNVHTFNAMLRPLLSKNDWKQYQSAMIEFINRALEIGRIERLKKKGKTT